MRNFALAVLGFLGQGIGFGLGVMLLVGVLILGGKLYYHRMYQPLSLEVAGQIAPSLILDHEFQLDLWHQNPGTLTKGTVEVRVSGAHLKGEPNKGKNSDTWSFDAWPPNKSERRRFSYYLDAVGQEVDLNIQIHIVADGIQDYDRVFRWRDNKWEPAIAAVTSK